MLVIVFVPTNFQQILVPFDCVIPPGQEDTPGVQPVVRSSPDVMCSDRDYNWYVVSTLANVGTGMLILVFCMILKIIRHAFKWQIGNKVRDHLPASVCIVELSVVDMKGYVKSIRKWMEHGHMSVPAYGLDDKLMERRGMVEVVENLIEVQRKKLALQQQLEWEAPPDVTKPVPGSGGGNNLNPQKAPALNAIMDKEDACEVGEQGSRAREKYGDWRDNVIAKTGSV